MLQFMQIDIEKLAYNKLLYHVQFFEEVTINSVKFFFSNWPEIKRFGDIKATIRDKKNQQIVYM